MGEPVRWLQRATQRGGGEFISHALGERPQIFLDRHAITSRFVVYNLHSSLHGACKR